MAPVTSRREKPSVMGVARRTVGGMVDLSSASTVHLTVEPAFDPAMKLHEVSSASQHPAAGFLPAHSAWAPSVKTTTLEPDPSKVRRNWVAPPVRHWNSVR